MNFIFVSPQFPKHYWKFCNALKKNGVNVLGIGDEPFDNLCEELKRDLTEYYFVPTLEDYDTVLRAVAYLEFKHGKIDWIESNNEFWLESDAKLRTDFNILTGFQTTDIEGVKNKSAMKKFYAKANIPTARLHKITDIEAAKNFVKLVKYPVVVKPDVGVGAGGTFKISSDADLEKFFAEKNSAPYVMEEFITGDICSYDAIVNAESEVLLEAMTFWHPTPMEVILTGADMFYYTAAQIPENLSRLGRAAAKSFGVKSRFVHFEFFRLTEAKEGLGKVGDFVGLEVNMRPAGGYATDMINFAYATDVYQVWADMVTENKKIQPEGEHCFAACGNRRDCNNYLHSDEEIFERYGEKIVMTGRLPEGMAPHMGDYMFAAKLQSQAEVEDFINFVMAV